MNYLQLVQESITRSGMRTALPSTLAGATDSVADWKAWVQDSWRELQEESTNWWFRQKLDQTLAISASTDEYSMPANLETLNYRTLTIYTTAKTDESPIKHIPINRELLIRPCVTGTKHIGGVSCEASSNKIKKGYILYLDVNFSN